MLDTRQYRSAGAPEGCDAAERIDGYCPSALDVSRTIAGQQQRDWLIDGLDRSQAKWNVLANQVPFAPNDTNADPAIRTFGGEKWDGYPFDRADILEVIATQRLYNTIVITGDANNPHLRFTDNHHGYVRCSLSREQYQADYRVVPSVLVDDGPISTLASFVVEHGRAGAQQV